MYCSPADLRNEGITEEQASDERLLGLCKLAGQYIDTITGQWFEPRKKTINLDGTGGETLVLPQFLIEANQIHCGGLPVKNYVLYNRISPEDDRNYPKIKRKLGWPKGELNIKISGLWGYVDEDHDGNHVIPPLIIHIAKRLVIMQLPLLGDVTAQKEKSERRLIVSETTDGHSYTLDRGLQQLAADRQFTGDSEIDQVLNRYMKRSMGLGLI